VSDADPRADTASTRPDRVTDDRPSTEASLCPGCGAALAVVPGLVGTHPGASPSCAGLFGVTVRGLRDEAEQDTRTAALLQLATDAYDAQHLRDDDPAAPAVRLCLWLERNADPRLAAPLAGRLADAAPPVRSRPSRWTTTVADLAADMDVVDLPTLVASWADAVWTDWAPAHPVLRAAADTALTGRDAPT
jgi:Family of unknown function (DUF5946)